MSDDAPRSSESEHDASSEAAGRFPGVPPQLQSALERRGFEALTSVQEAVLADAARGRDLRISSQTGSGKTVALGIALADVLLDNSNDGPPAYVEGPEVLVIAPTRELAQQVAKELGWLYGGVRNAAVDCVTGGTPVGPERRRLSNRPRVLVGTPGRLLDHIQSGALDVGGVQRLVLDEADQMLDLGFRDELEAILETMPAERRTHLVSATFPPAVVDLAARYQKNAFHVEGTRLGEANSDIEHLGYLVNGRQRHGAMINILLLAGSTRTLVFVRTRIEASQIAEKLAKDGFAAAPISGDLPQAQRTRTLNMFRRGSISTLVATDVAARGLDIPEVATIIHHSPPLDADTYTHRSGRTGRAGQKGRSILLASRNQRRRLEGSLADAKVRAKWSPAPSAAEVERALAGTARQHVEQLVENAPTCDDATRAFAQRLLAERSAEEVVAALVVAATPKPARKPVEIEAPEPFEERRDRRDARDNSFRDRKDRGGRGDRREGRPQRAGGKRGRNDERMVRFELTWGTRQGASPARVLAHLCRRADCDRTSFGNIDLGSHSTQFEVTESFARDFEQRTREPDRRDPELRIRRAHGSSARPARREDTRTARPHKGGFQRTFQRGFQRDFRKKSDDRESTPGGGTRRSTYRDKSTGGYRDKPASSGKGYGKKGAERKSFGRGAPRK